jgi:ribonuclease R
VEELMLLANETVAQFVTQKNVPAIFRNHAAPDPEKIARFASICEKLGIEFEEDDMSEAKRLSAFVKRLKSHPSRPLLDTLLVRSLKQAVYDVANIGHFGLASDAYLHFTSPIRRYPDLVVHRAVRAVLRGQKVDKSDEGIATMREAAQLASERERRAMQVERDVADLYGVFLMREKIGEQFTGSVSGIVGSGVFVTLDDPFVNVLVRSESLGQGPYEPDDDGFALVNTRTGDRIDLGDVMLVQIADTSLERRTTYATRVSEPGTGKAERPGTSDRRSADGKAKGRKGDKPGKDKKGDKKEGGRRQKSFGKPKKSDKPGKKSKKDSKKPARAARKKK